MIFGNKWLASFGLALLAVASGIFYIKNMVSHAETIPPDTIKQELEMMYNGQVKNLQFKNDIYGATLAKEGSVYAIQVDGDTGKVISMDIEAKSPTLAAKDKTDEPGRKKEQTAHEEQLPQISDKKKIEDSSKPSQNEPPIKKDSETVPNKVQPSTTNKTGKPPANPVKPTEKTDKPPVAVTEAPEKKEKPVKTVILTEKQAVQIALRQLNGKVDDVEFVKTTEGGYYLVQIDIDVDDGPDEATYQIHAISGKIMSVTWDD